MKRYTKNFADKLLKIAVVFLMVLTTFFAQGILAVQEVNAETETTTTWLPQTLGFHGGCARKTKNVADIHIACGFEGGVGHSYIIQEATNAWNGNSPTPASGTYDTGIESGTYTLNQYDANNDDNLDTIEFKVEYRAIVNWTYTPPSSSTAVTMDWQPGSYITIKAFVNGIEQEAQTIDLAAGVNEHIWMTNMPVRRKNVVSQKHNPIITAHPDLTKTLENNEAVNWSEGITATWGKTTSKTIPNDGTIDDQTLVGNNDPKLSSAGTNFDVVGWNTHTYRVKDSTNDGTFTDTTRKIIVKTNTAPDLKVYYASTSDEYAGEWLSQHASADADRRKAVDITATTTVPGTTYDTTILKGGAEVGFTTGNTHTVAGYTTESPTNAGEEFKAQLLGTGDHTIKLSAETAGKVVKIDSTVPVANATSSDNWITANDASSDALSGIAKTFVMFVAAGAPAPSMTDAGWLEISAGGHINPNLTAGLYDVYTYAIDNATNKSNVTQSGNNVLVASSDPALISAETSDGQPYTSGTWTNKDVTVKVKEPAGFSVNVNWYGAVYEGSVQKAKAATANSAGEYTYNTETNSTIANGYIVDASDSKLTAVSADMEVKIDKTKPIADVTYNAGVPNHKFTDTSTDGASGVKHTETKVAIVKNGDPAPSAGDYQPIDNVELPDDDKHYDVYVITEDNAGNKADPVKALENISRSGKDQLSAQHFARGINEGALSDSDAKALAVAKGKYYGGSDIPFADLVVDAGDLANINAKIAGGEKGLYDLKISTPATNPNVPVGVTTTQTVTVKVLINDNGNVNINTPDNHNDNSERIYGNDFVYGINNGAISADNAKKLASVNAFDTSNMSMDLSNVTVDQPQLDAINTAISNKDKSSVMPLTFSTPDGTSITVNVSLYDNSSSNPSAINEPSIAANNFNYGADEPDLTDTIAKTLSSAIAKDKFGNTAPNADINVNPAELATIVDAQHNGNVGTYPLTFEYEGKSTTITVTLLSHGAGNPGVSSHITANDFSYGVDEAPITDVIAKVRSMVSATDVNNNPIPVGSITVNAGELAAIQTAQTNKDLSAFPLTFTAPDGTSVTVSVSLNAHGGSGPGGPSVSPAYITGDDFEYGADEPDLTSEIAKILSNINGHDGNGMPIDPTTITVDPAKLAAIVDGQHNNVLKDYPLIFTTPDGTSVVITVTLKSHGAGNPGVSDHITGNDFVYGINEGPLTDIEAKLRSAVSATDANGTPIDPTLITVNPGDLVDINNHISNGEPGDYPITFTTPNGQSVTVTVNLRNEGIAPDPANGLGNIGGNNFEYNNGGGVLTEDKAKELAKIIAKDDHGSTIPLSNIVVDPAELATINNAISGNGGGEYPLTFTSPDGQHITIRVKLKQLPPAMKTPDKYLVTFLDCKGETVKIEWVKPGESATPPIGHGTYEGYVNVTSHRDLKPIGCAVNSTRVKVPRTGVNNNILGYAVLAMGSLLGLIILNIKKYKKQ